MIYGGYWIAFILAASAAASVTNKNIYSAFAVSAVVSLILDIFKLDIIWQIIAFAAVFVAFLYVLSKLYERKASTPASPEALVGKRCEVVEEINNDAGSGLVRVNGQGWSARAVYDGERYAPGEILSVVAVEGVKLICKK